MAIEEATKRRHLARRSERSREKSALARRWLVLVLLLGMAACGGDLDGGRNGGQQLHEPDEAVCEEICGRIYDSCRVRFAMEDGTAVEREDCVPECMMGLLSGNEPCLLDVECQRHSIAACLEFPTEAVEIIGDRPCDLDEMRPEFWERFELQVLVLVNQRRAEGATCGTEQKPPVPPLAMETTLWCAARRYSRKMADERFFDHVCPGGTDPQSRIIAEGYDGAYPVGENLALGSATAEQVVNGWMNSPGHCKNIMERQFKEIGIGYDDSNPRHRRVWTQKFGGGR